MHGGIAHRRAEFAHDPLADALLLRVIDDIRLLDHLARDVIGVAETVGEAQRDALFARPEHAGEKLRIVLETLAAPFFDRIDELRMDLIEHFLRVRRHFGRFRRKRVESALVLARRMNPALDAQLVHQAGEAETVHQHADRADDARLVDVDLVRRRRDVIATRRAHVVDDHIQRLRRIFRAQAPDLAIHDARLHRRTARAVDAQDHAGRAVILERTLQRGIDVVGAGVAVRGDFAFHVDERGMARGLRDLVAGEVEHAPGNQRGNAQQHETEEDFPAARGALFVDRRERDALKRGALPVFAGWRRHAVRSGGIGRELIGHAASGWSLRLSESGESGE